MELRLRNPTWTDAELLHHDFKVLDRPELAEPDLSRAKPPAGAPIRFLRSYDITPPSNLRDRRTVQPYVWCALCQEETHWKGWIAEYGDGLRCVIGQNCAKRNGGEVIRAAPAAATGQQKADEEARNAWQERCRPTVVTDREGLRRTRYAESDCDIGRVNTAKAQ